MIDAQTSGGLLVAVVSEAADDAVPALRDAGVESAAVIGRFIREGSGRIVVR